MVLIQTAAQEITQKCSVENYPEIFHKLLQENAKKGRNYKLFLLNFIKFYITAVKGCPLDCLLYNKYSLKYTSFINITKEFYIARFTCTCQMCLSSDM